MADAAALVADLLSGDESRAESAALELARLGPPALATLLPLIESSEVDTRWWALRAIAAITDRRSTEVLIRSLEDPAPAVRQAAALGLRLQPRPEAAAPLARHLVDGDPLTARLASDALASLGPPALEELRRAARAAEAASRINAMRALALMKDPAAIPDLFAALDDPSNLVQLWAERGLEDLGVGMAFFRAD